MPTTTSSKSFDPEALFTNKDLQQSIRSHLINNDFRSAIITAFSLPPSDIHTYHATASVTLSQTQSAINAGSAHGLHNWYPSASDTTHIHPSPSEIQAYISLFDPSKSFPTTLKGCLSNAKRDSLQRSIMTYLTTHRYASPSLPPIPKRKASHENPYMDFWAWSCHALQYAGPTDATEQVRMSHHVLPVFMHHFGCACPSYEALQILTDLTSRAEPPAKVPAKGAPKGGPKGGAKGVARRRILDVGSGNGYWSYMLRRPPHGCEVVAVDNNQSVWRTYWIDDTVVTDGVKYLRESGRQDGGEGDILLMVYPIVSGTVTQEILEAYKGDTVCIVGTQNGNGYTWPKGENVRAWFERERGEGWECLCQVPVPSFAGKDDALFVFRKVVHQS